jgi:uncharacterized membrane protein
MNERSADNALEVTLGRVLRAGVRFSTAALAAGLASALGFGAGRVTTVLLVAGVVTLIATPVARVLISSIAYIRRHDWMFAALTLIVLAELVASIVAAVR